MNNIIIPMMNIGNEDSKAQDLTQGSLEPSVVVTKEFFLSLAKLIPHVSFDAIKGDLCGNIQQATDSKTLTDVLEDAVRYHALMAMVDDMQQQEAEDSRGKIDLSDH